MLGQCRQKLLFPLLRRAGGAAAGAARTGSVRFMGGGPRTFPGGVNKWQWKRMQEKKKRERDKIWLAKERSLYERRRRAQIMALMPLRPWEKIHPESPPLPRVDKDPKILEMARRFQRDDGVDLWTKADGPDTCNALVRQDLDGDHKPGSPLRAYHPLALSLSQRVSDVSSSQRAAQDARLRFRRPFCREEKDPPDAAEVFQHSRFMLASYLRKQGHMGLPLGFSESSFKHQQQPVIATSDSSSAGATSGERTDYTSWLNALANDRARLAERQESLSRKNQPHNAIAHHVADGKTNLQGG